MSAGILVGSCSWADKTLIDSGWYPPPARSPEDRLRYYAEHFPIVEVDSTYYAIPRGRNPELWAERTPAVFTFNIKCYALFTGHAAAVRAFPKELREGLPAALREKPNVYLRDLPPEMRAELWRRFTEVLLPLDSAGKLGVVLFQFPPWFGPSRANRDYIIGAKERLGQYRMAVEFRNANWMATKEDQARSLRFLAEHAIPYVCVDEPQGFKSSIPPVAAATSPVALVRMHGRNAEMWTRKARTAAERFDYLYTEDELQEWAPRVRRLAQESREVHVLFNNCHRDYSVRNARQMIELLSSEGVAAPPVSSTRADQDSALPTRRPPPRG
jgi:uncharacterized protein YecE (DUF72 family)